MSEIKGSPGYNCGSLTSYVTLEHVLSLFISPSAKGNDDGDNTTTTTANPPVYVRGECRT